jgi:hypothetical protein
MRWWMLKPGQDPSGILPYTDKVWFDVPCSTNITELRQSKKGSANFVIPADMLGVPSVQGNVYLVEAEVDSNVKSLTGPVSPPRAPLRVAWTLIDYQPQPRNPPFTGQSLADEPHVGWTFPLMRKLYPMRVYYYKTPKSVVYTAQDIRADGGLGVMTEIQKYSGLYEPKPDVLIGWLPKGASVEIGKGIIGLEQAGDAWCIQQPNYERSMECLAHEVGHALGLIHTTPGSASLPYDTCAPLQGSLGETGFDYLYTYVACGGSQNFLPYCPNGEAAKFPYDIQVSYLGSTDFMTANSGDWVSPFDWNRLLKKPYSLEWSNCSPSKAASFSAFSSPSVLSTSLGQAVILSGQVASSGSSGALDPALQVQSAGPFPASDDTGSYCLDFRSGADLLASHCFNASFINPETGDSLSTMTFAFKLPLPDGIDRVVLNGPQGQLDEIIRSANAPIVSITSAPPSGSALTGSATVSWAGSDLDGDALIYTALYSHDGGQSLLPLVANTTSTSLTIDASQLPGGVAALVRILASDGMNTTAVDLGPYQVANKPPVVIINAPVDGAVVNDAEKLILVGTAQDLEDEEITEPTAFQWQVDNTASLGTGPELVISSDSLSAGNHSISLTAVDSSGIADTANVQVTVTSAPFALCHDVTASADAQCMADESIDIGSYDPDGGPVSIVLNPEGPYALGVTSVGLTVTDELGVTDQCIGVVTVEDTTPPALFCNADSAIVPSVVPISFNSSALDSCSGSRPTTITDYSCYKEKKGKLVDKSESCIVQIDGGTLTILDSGGVDNNIEWVVTATDAVGNSATTTCHVAVVKK